MSLFARLTARAKDNLRKIVLPEGDETRNLTAADQILADNVAEIILLGEPEAIMAKAAELGLKNISKATIVNPADEAVIDKYAPLLFELRKKKGMTMEEARTFFTLEPCWSRRAMPTAWCPARCIPPATCCARLSR